MAKWRAEGSRTCLVPTMGSIHAGHIALIKRARELGDRVIVSIYVNPSQFSNDEDFDTYPRNSLNDKESIASTGNVDAIYAPMTMYGDQHSTNIVPVGLATTMEGLVRPHFFTGVATIVFKLFQHVPADFAIFGEKDFQQFAVLQQMVTDLDIPITVISHPTIREVDGLALSSRNQYLSKKQRQQAPILYKTIKSTAAKILSGASVENSIALAKQYLIKTGFDKIEYFDLRSSDQLTPTTTPRSIDRLFVAVWLGKTRLIDNCTLGSDNFHCS